VKTRFKLIKHIDTEKKKSKLRGFRHRPPLPLPLTQGCDLGRKRKEAASGYIYARVLTARIIPISCFRNAPFYIVFTTLSRVFSICVVFSFLPLPDILSSCVSRSRAVQQRIGSSDRPFPNISYFCLRPDSEAVAEGLGRPISCVPLSHFYIHHVTHM
jgi:hypothetical protein